jgi:hypothetical protein
VSVPAVTTPLLNHSTRSSKSTCSTGNVGVPGTNSPKQSRFGSKPNTTANDAKGLPRVWLTHNL